MNEQQLFKSKILDMNDLKRSDFEKVNSIFDSFFGLNWPEVPLRRWEYVAAVIFSGIMEKPGYCLDAGCGRNVFAHFLAMSGCKIVCTDIGQHRQGGNRIEYLNMSMHEMSFEDNHFDYVFAMSSIEHVNAGRYKIAGMDFDVGDTQAMKELVRVLKPGGILILTTDYADKYYPPPGLWHGASHRIYDYHSILDRLFTPVSNCMILEDGLSATPDFDWTKLKEVEPIGYDYTEMIMTLQKC